MRTCITVASMHYRSPRSSTLRRLILAACVAAALLVVLTSCTTLDVACGMRADYKPAAPIPAAGRITFAWAYGQGFEDLRYGEAIPGGIPIIRMAGEPPTFN